METFPTERKGCKFPADKTKMGREKQKRWNRETVIQVNTKILSSVHVPVDLEAVNNLVSVRNRRQ